MGMFEFAAARQQVFHVNVGGRTRLVQFGERNAYGASTYQTPEPLIAAAIRRTSMFLRGVITEITPFKEIHAEKTVETVAVPAGKAAGTVAVHAGNAAGTAAEEVKNVIEVDNFTQAKEAVIKMLGIERSKVKTHPSLMKVAKENGITIKYKEK